MMRLRLLLMGALSIAVFGAACTHKSASTAVPKPSAFGAALVESSGGKQIGAIGAALPQPVVVQVNDEQGAAVPGALVEFSGPAGVRFDPSSGLTDSGGQFTSNISLGCMAGLYEMTARTLSKSQKTLELKVEEIALGYQQTLGRQLNDQYCDRCHNPESTVERVSNYDNLEVKSHPFSEGETLNKLSDADLAAIITHGGPALNKSPLMPAYGYTLSKSDIQALISYIRSISDPPYPTSRLVYANN
jgi:mono/diheme cytochrome c family protein